MKRRIPLALIAAAALAASSLAPAGVKVERVDAATEKPKLYGLSLHDMTSAELVAEFRKQTDIDLIVENEDNPNRRGGPAIVYDLDFTGLNQSEATLALARVLGMGVNRFDSGPVRLNPGYSSSENVEKHDQPGVELAYVNRSQTFPPNPQMMGRDNQLSLQLRVWSGRTPMAGQCRLELTDVTDDKNQKIEQPEKNGNMYDAMRNDQYMMDTNVQLQLPSPPPKSLAVVKGRVVMQRPKTLLRLTVDGFDDKPMETDFDGATLSIGPVTPDTTNGFALPMVFTRNAMPPEQWQRLQQRINAMQQSAVVRSGKGETLVLQPRGWSGGNDTIRVQTVVNRGYNSRNAGPATRPASMRWDTVVETTEDSLPFELHDVQVP